MATARNRAHLPVGYDACSRGNLKMTHYYTLMSSIFSTRRRSSEVIVKGAVSKSSQGERYFFRLLVRSSKIPRELLEANKGGRVLLKLKLPNGEIRTIICTLNYAPNDTWRLLPPKSQIDDMLIMIFKEGLSLPAEIEFLGPAGPQTSNTPT